MDLDNGKWAPSFLSASLKQFVMLHSQNAQAESQNQPVLHKDSGVAEIKTYFSKVSQMQTNGDEFPVDLAEVWPLAYSRKKNAVKTLKNDFIEGIDYQTITQKGKAGSHNATIVHKYFLTVPCMEYFIAKRVKPVFEVYRKVFHAKIKTVLDQRDNIKELSPIIENGIIDVRDVPYTATKINGKNVRKITLSGIPLYLLADVNKAVGIKTRNYKIARQLNARTENAVKVATFGNGVSWFVNDAGLNLIFSRQNMFGTNQLNLAL